MMGKFKTFEKIYTEMDELLKKKNDELKSKFDECKDLEGFKDLTAVCSRSYGQKPDGKKFKCFHRLDIKKGKETLYYITFVWQDIDVKTGNIHSQFGKVQIYEKVKNGKNESKNEINESENNSKKWVINYSEGKNDSKGYFNFDEAPYVGDGEKFIDDIIRGFQSFLKKSKFKKEDLADKGENEEWNELYGKFCMKLKIKRNIIKCVLDNEKIGKLDDEKTAYSNNFGRGKNKEYFWIDSKNKEEDYFSILLSTAFLDSKTGNIYTEFGKIQFCKSIDGKKDFNEYCGENIWEINYPTIDSKMPDNINTPEEIVEKFEKYIENNK